MLGLPQGDFLWGASRLYSWSFIFILYVNDLNNASMLDAILFADDTNLFISHKDPVYLINTLKRELNKCQPGLPQTGFPWSYPRLILWYSSLGKKKPSFEFQVSINEQSILRVSETMFLGVVLDDNLTWKPHISLLASKLSKSIGIIYKSRFFSQINLSVPCTIEWYFHTYTIAI